MILKIFKAVWFLSLLGFMAIFLYIYASLPENVAFGDEVGALSLPRDAVFYMTLAIGGLVNALVFIISRLYGNSNDSFSSWFFGQIILLNLFFCTVLGFINVLNSGEKFEYERLGVVIYGSIILIVVWAIGWPVFSFSRKFGTKQPV